MSFPRYPAYKDSGVAWFGEVPKHWQVAPLKAFIDRIESGVSVNATDTPAEGEQFGVLKTSCVYTGQFDAAENKAVVNAEYDRVACPVVANTLIVSRMNTPDLVGAAGLTKADHPTLFLPDRLWQVFPKDASADFMHFWTRTASYRAQVEMACAGTSSSMQNLGQDDFRSFMFVSPPPDEQVEIAGFLDRETAKIDALVAEQEQLITLLKEKRQAVISHAVTKGLDPSVPMKDSGVEWLGEVPEQWSITPIKHFGRLKGGAGFPHSEQGVEGEELCFYKVGALGQSSSKDYLTESENTVSRETACALGAFIFPKETLVFAKVGAALFLGRVRALPADACLDNNMMGLVVDQESHSPAFVRYAMSLVRFDLIANPGAVPSLNEGQIGNYVLACPPSKAEQGDIAAFLDHATVQLEDLLAQAESVIATLQERRSALISAAVTGQIDIRGKSNGIKS